MRCHAYALLCHSFCGKLSLAGCFMLACSFTSAQCFCPAAEAPTDVYEGCGILGSVICMRCICENSLATNTQQQGVLAGPTPIASG